MREGPDGQAGARRRRRTIYLLVFLAALTLHAALCFRTELIPGINGAYPLVQIRSVLTHGSLGFVDMPLHFYLLAALVRVGTWFSGASLEVVAPYVVKAVGALLVPAALLPWMLIVRELRPQALPAGFEALLALLITCTMSPLTMLAGYQKNALAVPLVLAFLLGGIRFLTRGEARWLFWAGTALVLVASTHFGAMTFAVFLLALALLLHGGWRVWPALLAVAAATLSAVFLLDPVRAHRLLFVLPELLSRPILLYGRPPDIVLYGFSYLVLAAGIVHYHHFAGRSEPHERLILAVCLAAIAMISFPLFEADIGRRLSMMLFIPQGLVCLFVWSAPGTWMRAMLVAGTALFVSFSVLDSPAVVRPVISAAVHADLRQVERAIDDRRHTLVIARHGLEWWVAWSLGVKVGNSRALEPGLLDRYESVLVLEQKHPPPPPRGPKFPEPTPSSGQLREVLESEHFRVHRWTASEP